LAESHSHALRLTSGRLNPEARRTNVKWFSSTFDCRDFDCKYKIYLNKLSEENFQSFQVVKTGEHKHSFKQSTQLRGDEREQLVTLCKTDYKISAETCLVSLKARCVSYLPNEEALRKAKSEINTMDNVSTCWITNLIAAAEMGKSTIKGKHLNGSIRRMDLFPNFILHIHTEQTIKCIEHIKEHVRFLHIDATGSLTRIDKTMAEYGQILNYGFLLKDFSDLEKLGYPIADVATSRHDTFPIMEMCRLVKNDYHIIFRKKLYFRLVVIDYSWAIHATLMLHTPFMLHCLLLMISQLVNTWTTLTNWQLVLTSINSNVLGWQAVYHIPYTDSQKLCEKIEYLIQKKHLRLLVFHFLCF